MNVEPPGAAERRRGSWVAPLLVIVAGVLAYANSLGGALVFDDIPAIRENPTIRQLWPLTTPLSPPRDTGVGGRPLANLSFALTHALGAGDVRVHHAGNLLLHLGSALLLLGIVRRSLAGHAPQALGVATAAAACWVVHPLTTGTVTWLSQRTELLMAFCHLLTLSAFVRARDDGARGWQIVSIATCALGMLSKEVMVTAPVLVLLYDRTFVAGSFAGAWRARRGYYLALAATWLVLAYSLRSDLSQRSVGFGLGVSPLQYTAAETHAVLTYLKLAFWPHPLVFDYGAVYPTAPLRIGVAAVAVLGLLVVTGALVARRPRAGFLPACFFLLLAPTSSFVPVAQQPIAENRAYLPLAAVIAGLVCVTYYGTNRARHHPGIFHLLGDKKNGTGEARRPGMGGAWAAAVAIALALGGLTVDRNRDYRSEFALWTDTVHKRPQNPRAHFNLGVALLDRQRPAEARDAFARAIELNPLEPKHHHSLGNALLELDRPAEALPHFATALRLQPTYGRAWYNYGTALLRTGDVTGAIARLERAVQLDPASAEVRQALGNAHFQQDRPAAALEHYQAALRIDPRVADAHYNAGSAALELGRTDAAVTHFAAAAELKPADAEIRNNLGAALLLAGRTADAIAAFEAALRIDPGHANARDNLAVARAPAPPGR